jgi:FkbM family methyltransferase
VDLFAEVCNHLTRPINGRGYWRLLQLLPARGYRIWHGGQTQVIFDSADKYWAVLRSNNFQYEPEISSSLRRLSNLEFGFIDAGANIGFWTAWVQSELSISNIVAIEPNPEIFPFLQINNMINGAKATCLEAALTVLDEEQVTLFVPQCSGGHAAGSLNNSSNSKRKTVAATNMRLLLETYMKGIPNIVIKLDVEGIEPALLHEITEMQDTRLIIIYEDHGRDRDSKATNTALKMPDYEIYFLSRNGSWIRIRKTEEINSLKTNHSRGYNCIAIPRRLARQLEKISFP